MHRRLSRHGFALASLTLATAVACGQDEPFGPAAAAGAGGVAALDAATGDGAAGTPQGGADSSLPEDAAGADVAKEAAVDAALADAGDAHTAADAADATATIVPDFALTDENPASSTYQDSVSPRDYLGQVSAWYFGHAT